MSIELSSTAINPKAATGAGSSKGKVKSGDETDLPEGGVFSAVLTSIEPPSGQAEDASTQATTEDASQTALLPVADPTIALAPNLPRDLAMFLAQAGEVAGGRTLEVVDTSRLLATTVTKANTDSAIGVATPELLSGKAVSLGEGKTEDYKQSVHALLEQIEQTLPDQSHTNKGLRLPSGAAASLAALQAPKQSSLADAMAREPALSGAILTSGMGDGLLRPADRSTVKSSFLPVGSGIEGMWGQSALQVGNKVDAPSAMVDPSMQSLETMVADTVNYWVTQGVQNAQLKLDGFGDKPVEVNISLKGDEAHIGFRTDQPEIRQILEGAVAHLKDLLTSEGLVLSGVSVGTSGQDGSAAQDQRNRPGTRQATLVTTDTLPAEGLHRVNKSAGRALDLYV